MFTLIQVAREPVLIILKKALLRIRKGWCQGASARTATGRATCSSSRTAVKWCAYGAMIYIDNNRQAQNYAAKALVEEIKRFVKTSDWSVVLWNDKPHRRQRNVIRLYERTIRRLESGQLSLDSTKFI